MSDNENNESTENKTLLDKKKLREEFIERVESNLRRSEKDIWFIKNEDHPQKESLTKNAHK